MDERVNGQFVLPVGGRQWFAAWVLDPTVSLVLLAILRGEQVTSRYQVHTGPWVRVAKWFALAATYVMNTWASYAAGSLSGVVLHSVPPLLVFVAAEAITDLRDKLSDAVLVAFTEARQAVHERVDEPTRPAKHRRSFGEYLAIAQAAWSPGVVITPAWVREVTGCSRGLSPRLAKALVDEITSAADGGGRP